MGFCSCFLCNKITETSFGVSWTSHFVLMFSACGVQLKVKRLYLKPFLLLYSYQGNRFAF